MMVTRRSRQGSALLAVLLFCSALAGGADNGYHVLARYKLAGRGKTGNLRIDAEARRLYVAHGDRVDVLNLDTGVLAGSIPASGGNDVVLAPEAKHGFISDSTNASLIMFDLATLKVLKTIKLNTDKPGALEYDPDVKRVFVATNGGVTAIDADSGELSGNVSLEGRLRSLVSNGYGRLYVAAEDKNVVHVVDTRDLKFLGDFPIGNGRGPSGLALDPSGRRLFVACTNGHLPIVDTDIGFTFQELEIGKGSVNDVFTFTPQGKGGWRGAVFAASSDGTLSLIKMNAFINYSHDGEIKIQPGVDSLAFDPKTHHLFLPTSSGAAEILVVGQ